MPKMEVGAAVPGAADAPDAGLLALPNPPRGAGVDADVATGVLAPRVIPPRPRLPEVVTAGA